MAAIKWRIAMPRRRNSGAKNRADDKSPDKHAAAFLTPEPGLNSGFMIAQVTAAALTSENKALATPHSVDSISTSGNQEDYVSMGMSGARRLERMLVNLRHTIAIELLCACQESTCWRLCKPARWQRKPLTLCG